MSSRSPFFKALLFFCQAGGDQRTFMTVQPRQRISKAPEFNATSREKYTAEAKTLAAHSHAYQPPPKTARAPITVTPPPTDVNNKPLNKKPR